MKTIKCKKCGKVKPLSEYYIGNPARTKNQCKECYKAYYRAYRKDHYIRTMYRPKPKKIKRQCNNCDEWFWSKGNHTCPACKKAHRRLDFYEPIMYSLRI